MIDWEKTVYILTYRRLSGTIHGSRQYSVTKVFWSKTEAEKYKEQVEKNERNSKVDLRRYDSPEDR